MPTFTKPLKLSDLMEATTFELNSIDDAEDIDEDIDGPVWNVDNQNADAYKNPCGTSFIDWKKEMIEISEGIFKKVLKPPTSDAKMINLQRTRVTYHRNLYLENEDQPFDSTYLNGKTGEICLALKRGNYLEGILDALSSMKEGEQSLFIVTYKKMFKELGCAPRIREKADILCDLKVLKVEEVGDQNAIKKLLSEESDYEKFANIKDSVEETRIRACDCFSLNKISKAIKLYQRIIHTVRLATTSNETEKKQKIEILSLVHTNLAVCYNKNENWMETMSHIQQLEDLGALDKITKALYAKGRALTKLGKNKEALNALAKALKQCPMDRQIISAIEELKQRKIAYDNFQQAFAKNLKLV